MSESNAYRKIDFWRIFQVAAVCSLVILYIFQWGRMILTASLRTGADFIHFYVAGQIAQEYGFSSVYDLDLQQKMEQVVVGFTLAKGQVLPFNHMPYLIPFLKLLVTADYVG